MEASDAWRHLRLENEGILMGLRFHFISVLFKNNKALAGLATVISGHQIHHRLRPYQLSCTLISPALCQTLAVKYSILTYLVPW